MLVRPSLNAVLAVCGILAVVVAGIGCGGGKKSDSQATQTNPPPSEVRPAPSNPVNKPGQTPAPVAKQDRQSLDDPPFDPPQPKDKPTRILGDLIKGNEADKPFLPDRMPIDEDRVRLHGIRKLEGKHVVLYTDLPSRPDVDELPKVFDMAVPQWCEYFKIDPQKVADWRMSAFIMKEKTKFQAAAVMPDDLPPFQFGFQRGWEFWLYEQLTEDDKPAVYYRRHLFLHEGTHGFMNFFMGGAGPLWYMEAMAELLATHWWDGQKLTLNYTPKSKQELPYWGRVKIIKDDFANRSAKWPVEIMSLRPDGQLSTEIYAWCWAIATFFDKHPAYQERFRALQKKTVDRTDTFTVGFVNALKPDETRVSEDWLLFVMDMDYGYDVARAAVQHKLGERLPAGGTTVEIAADRGWQSTGVLLEEGKTYRITATGRYQIGDQPKIWWCEPNGVTIDYHRGQPLGKLLGAVRNDETPLDDGITALATPEPIGLEHRFIPQRTGTLYLKINESPAGLRDNAGKLTVKIVAP